MKENYGLEDFVFELPEELIAQRPAARRGDSRLLVLNRKTGGIKHKLFNSLPEEIRPGDALVFNNARVIYSRLFCRRSTGAKVEIVLTQRLSLNRWLIICNRTKRLKTGEVLMTEKQPSVEFTVLGRRDDFLEVLSNREISDELLEALGEIPLPPYIKRPAEAQDGERYQTVYASESGAAAAPTAGLHFTKEMLTALENIGAELLFLTLYVSWGTFMPVRENDLSLHRMHCERYVLPEDTAEKINSARSDGRRIIAVGTTVCRVLEASFEDRANKAGTGETAIFIKPPMKVKAIDGLITNFHTPASTLLMLVAAFAGYDLIMEAYRTAVKERYGFFSYGDAMLIV